MQTVICDRCGKKLFSKKPIGSFRGEYYAPRGFRGNVWIDRFLGYKIVDVDIDLCEDCAKEPAEWLHIDNNNSRNA